MNTHITSRVNDIDIEMYMASVVAGDLGSSVANQWRETKNSSVTTKNAKTIRSMVLNSYNGEFDVVELTTKLEQYKNKTNMSETDDP